MHDSPVRSSNCNLSSQSHSQVNREHPSTCNPYNHPGLYSNLHSHKQEPQPSLEVQRILQSESLPQRSQNQSHHQNLHLPSRADMSRGDYYGNNQNSMAASKFKTKFMASPETRGGTSLGNGDYGRETTATAVYGNRDGITRGSAKGTRSCMPTASRKSMTGQYNPSPPPQSQQPQFERNATSDSVSLKRSPSRFLSSQYIGPASLGGHRAPMSSMSKVGESHNLGKYGPDREKMKNDLAYSNSIAKSSIPGVGILPGSEYLNKNAGGRRQYHNSFINARSDMGSSNSPYYSSLQPIVMGGNEIQGSQSSTTAMSRAQAAIENLRSNVSKANDLAHDNLDAYKNSHGSWINQGMPSTDDQASFDAKISNTQKRRKQESYRDELERQIQQTKLRKDEENKRAETHPLGAKYDIPGLSHWHQQTSTVIPPEKVASIAKLLLEKSSSSRLNQSPENARKQAALENLRKSRVGPNPFPNNYPNGGNAATNNNIPSQAQSHSGAQAFRTNSSMSAHRPDVPSSYPQQSYNNSSQNMGPNSNYNQLQLHPQFQQSSSGNNSNLPQGVIDPTQSQYQPQKPNQDNYPNNNNIPTSRGQPVPVPYTGGYGVVGPWPNMMQQQPYQQQQQPGYYPGGPGTPHMKMMLVDPYQEQLRTHPQNPAYPNGFFQGQNGRLPIQPNPQMPQGGQVQYQNQQPREVQQHSQRHFNAEEFLPPQNDANINRRPQPPSYSEQDEDIETLAAKYILPANGTEDRNPVPPFLTQKQLVDFEKLKEDGFVKQKSWQVSDDLPDSTVKDYLYKLELKQQIDQNELAKYRKLAREAEEEAKLERKIEEYHNQEKNRQNKHYEKQYAKKLLQAQSEAYVLREPERLENTEIILAKKLKSREHLGDGDLRQQQQPFRPKNIEPKKTVNRDRPRRWSPPIPAVQRQLEYASEIGLPPIRSNAANNQPKLGLDLDFMSALQSTISSERERVERSLREKLDTSNGTNGYDGYY